MNEREVKKVSICLRGAENSYGSLVFTIPKHISKRMNKNGKFLITIEEIKDFSFSHGRVVIEPL